MQLERRVSGYCDGLRDRRIMRLPDRPLSLMATYLVASAFAGAGVGHALAQSGLLVGAAAFGDWRADQPGVSRLIKPEDLPRPGATPSSANVSHVLPRPPAVLPPVPAHGTEPRTGRSPPPRTASGCWYRSVPPAMTQRGSEARQEDCKRGVTNTRSAQVGEARPTAQAC